MVTSEGMTFRMYAPANNASSVGQATLSVATSANPVNNLVSNGRARKTLAGVPLNDLRRTVINRMVSAGGWVVNDLEREIGGHHVYVVLAQTASDGRTPQQSRLYYFVEMDGRIYELASSAPLEFSERLAAESEQVITSLRSTQTTTSQR